MTIDDDAERRHEGSDFSNVSESRARVLGLRQGNRVYNFEVTREGKVGRLIDVVRGPADPSDVSSPP